MGERAQTAERPSTPPTSNARNVTHEPLTQTRTPSQTQAKEEDGMTDIFKMLLDLEESEGQFKVRDACKRYIMKKTYAGQMLEKRRSIPARWLGEAYVEAKWDMPQMWREEVSG